VEAAVIEGTFDARTLARMNLALDRVCQTIADGETHAVRKRVARRIIKCARRGKTSVEELTSAGQRAIARFARSDQSRLSYGGAARSIAS
jgi:predicted MarR family transcription regulator